MALSSRLLCFLPLGCTSATPLSTYYYHSSPSFVRLRKCHSIMSLPSYEGRFMSGVPAESRGKPRVIHARRKSDGGSVREDGNGALGEEFDGGGNGNGALLVNERPVDARIIPMELHKEATESYLAYAMSVLVGRALPDVRDGLKPVHRRILFAMHELGLSSREPYKKCARVVGEVLGKFHPHGDTAVYDALVRMAQG